MRLLVVLLVVFMTLTVNAQDDELPESPVQRCMNLGNMLEAPNEGDWGVRVEEDYLATIADAGFDTVRIPVRWSNHADETAPYTIDETFMERVHEVVDWALEADLKVILNVHHYEEIMSNPQAHTERLEALWRQIAESFTDYPDTVIFELLNEPFNEIGHTLWNALYPDLIAVIRESNPERLLLFGGDMWNSAYSLDNLILPEDTDNLIVTFHFYEPFTFTHQGAEWTDGADAWLGTTFGSAADMTLIQTTFDKVQAWGIEHQMPIILGEFGAYSRAPMESRLLYTETVRQAAEERGFGWCYWEFASGFGIYDPVSHQFNELLLTLID